MSLYIESQSSGLGWSRPLSEIIELLGLAYNDPVEPEQSAVDDSGNENKS